jgi:hypothetical protein
MKKPKAYPELKPKLCETLTMTLNRQNTALMSCFNPNDTPTPHLYLYNLITPYNTFKIHAFFLVHLATH